MRTNPTSVALGDLNGDGKLDLAVTNIGSDSLSVLLGTGTFAAQALLRLPSSLGNPASVAFGDLNRDGNLDIALANFDAEAVSVLLGTGNGTFPTLATYQVPLDPYSVALDDLNGDGKLDLVAGGPNNGAVAVLLGTGTGTLVANSDTNIPTALTPSFGTTFPYSVLVGDLNADGRPDVVSAGQAWNAGVLLQEAPILGLSTLFGAKPEGDLGATIVTFNVIRVGDQSAPTTVSYAITGLGVSPATADDFVGGIFPSGTVTIPARQATATFAVLVAGLRSTRRLACCGRLSPINDTKSGSFGAGELS